MFLFCKMNIFLFSSLLDMIIVLVGRWVSGGWWYVSRWLMNRWLMDLFTDSYYKVCQVLQSVTGITNCSVICPTYTKYKF